MLVYCGGVSTEVDYFESMKESLGESATVAARVEGAGVAPVQVVRAAVNHRNRRPGAYDEVWCVFDVDDFDILPALAEARRQNVNLAISNPCFEVWLLLHHADCTSHCSGYADVVRRLKKHVPSYEKSRLSYSAFAHGVSDAINRAKRLGSAADGWRHNPSTSVWRLVERIVGEP